MDLESLLCFNQAPGAKAPGADFAADMLTLGGSDKSFSFLPSPPGLILPELSMQPHLQLGDTNAAALHPMQGTTDTQTMQLAQQINAVEQLLQCQQQFLQQQQQCLNSNGGIGGFPPLPIGPLGIPLPTGLHLPGTSIKNPLPSKIITRDSRAAAALPQQAQQPDTNRHNPSAAGLAPFLLSPPGNTNSHDDIVARLNGTGGMTGMNTVGSSELAAGSLPPGSTSTEAPSQQQGQPPRRRGGRSPDQAARSSRFRGVTKHRRSQRYEAHIWVKDMGRQVYLGGYECEEHAAEAFDIAALKCKGTRTKINFELSKYSDLLGYIDRMSIEELVMAVRRQSQGFSRGSSSYRGVTHHPSGRWEARIGIPGSKHVYLGLYNDEKEAAKAYDRALVRLRGRAAATNFSLSEYSAEMTDFQHMQGGTQRNDAHYKEISTKASLFERWVRGGSEAFPELPQEDEGTGDEDEEEDDATGVPVEAHGALLGGDADFVAPAAEEEVEVEVGGPAAAARRRSARQGAAGVGELL